jgi:hypothetical protein
VTDPAKTGTDWQDGELDLILADYFAMLTDELAGRPYVKAHHRASLMAQLGRTDGSVEFKHMNVSAVLGELGYPTIAGYRPRSNYQDAIIAAVERYLDAHPDLRAALDEGPVEREQLAQTAETPGLFEEDAPTRGQAPWHRHPEMARLVRKFDPSERDARNRALGRDGESLIFEAEQVRLRTADRADLARRVRWVSQEDGDGAGYDILSFNLAGQERLLEVKTTRGMRTTPFLLTSNEHALSAERPEAFRIHRLYDFSKTPRLFKLRPPLEEAVWLRPEVYRAFF